MTPIFSRSWFVKMQIVPVRLRVPAILRSAWLISRAWRPTWESPISPSISARGTSAATESITSTSSAPERIRSSAISSACSPLSVWLTAASSACSRSMRLSTFLRARDHDAPSILSQPGPTTAQAPEQMFGYPRGATGRGSSLRVCRGCHDMRAQQLQGGDGGPGADDGAVARPLHSPALASCRRRDVQVDEADRLLLGAAGRPGDAGHRDRDVGPEPLARALGHRLGYLGADGAVRLEQLRGHSQER